MVLCCAICMNHRGADAVLNTPGALFGLTADVEMQGFSGARREWKMDDKVAPKVHPKLRNNAIRVC